jgi:hypothetical protein
VCRLLNLQPCLLVSITNTSGFSRDAGQFALVALTQGRRAETWIVTDCGLFAPEDLPRIAQKLAA